MMMTGYRWNLIETAHACQRVGMAAIILKNRYGLSSELAFFANRFLGKQFYRGTLVLNGWTGGLNEKAVKELPLYGEGICAVEMPTFHAENEMRWLGMPKGNGVPVFVEGKLTDKAKRVLETIGSMGLTLKTGHLSPEESLCLIEQAEQFGIETVVVTHVTAPPVMASIREQKQMVSMGAYLEHCVVPLMSDMPKRYAQRYEATPRELFSIEKDSIVSAIREIGPEYCVLGTDLGQDINPSSAFGMKMFVQFLLEAGFNADEIRRMIVENPRKLFGFDDVSMGNGR
jgi:hypothetical protein